MMRKCFVCAVICLSAFSITARSLPFSCCAYASEKRIKTSYKQYKVFKLDDATVICEPYTVKKDDWLYKIFRKKGMISEENFPRFLNLFSRINPDIRNIDKIEPGERIMIPLKKVKKNEYRETGQGIVKMPVLEYDKMPEAIKKYVSAHEVESGDSISELIDKRFLNKDGSLTRQGMKAFKMANPGVKNISMIYKGSTVYLPEPAILSAPWFQKFFKTRQEKTDGQSPKPGRKKRSEPKKKKPETLNPHTLSQLNRYASLVRGTLLTQGEYRFPSQENADDRVDLSTTPLITLKNGSRILLVPDEMEHQEMVSRMRLFWKNLKVRKISRILDGDKASDSVTTGLQETNEAFIERLLSFTDYDVQMDADISFFYGQVEVHVTLARVARENARDVLIDFGDMYGNAFDLLQARGYKVLSITSQAEKMEAASLLFNALDLSVTRNPMFEKNKQLIRAEGMYVSGTDPEIFVAASDPNEDVEAFIKRRKIELIPIALSDKEAK